MPTAQAPRSHRRTGRIVLLVLALLAVLGVLGDRIAAAVAEAEVGRRLQNELGTAARPEVDIGGFPFLTQLASGEAKRVHLVAENTSPPDEEALPAKRLDVVAEGVNAPAGQSRVTADHVDGTATIDFAALPQVGGESFTYAGDGRVALEVGSLASTLPGGARVVGRPQLDVEAQTVTLDEPKITVAGIELPDTTARSILGNASDPVPLTEVPLGLRVTSLTANEEGLQAQITGDDVVLRE